MSESNLQCTWLNDKFVNSTRRIGTHVLNYNLHPRILTWDHAEILVDYMNGEKNDGTDCKVAYMDHKKKKKEWAIWEGWKWTGNLTTFQNVVSRVKVMWFCMGSKNNHICLPNFKYSKFKQRKCTRYMFWRSVGAKSSHSTTDDSPVVSVWMWVSQTSTAQPWFGAKGLWSDRSSDEASWKSQIPRR